MAYIILNKKKLEHNYYYLNSFFKDNAIQWSAVSKILCGHRKYLQLLLDLKPQSISDSRISNLKTVKQIDPLCQTIYIKPPSKAVIADIIQYADISLNSDLYTIDLLNQHALKKNMIHKIILMIDLGELREGVMRDDFLDLFAATQKFKNIQVVGIGSNLSCLYGVLPNADKLNQLNLYKQLVEIKHNIKLDYLSGGSSVTIPLIQNQVLPKQINHFRVGETLFMGTNAFDHTAFENLEQNVFELRAEIIELYEKPIVPSGELGVNVDGQTTSFDQNDVGKKTIRALIDIGLLDVDIKHLTSADPSVIIEAATSDITVLDLGENLNNYKVGSSVKLHLDYMGIVRIMNSKYIDKVID
ncbi:alanine racemase [Myroides sp. LJL119]